MASAAGLEVAAALAWSGPRFSPAGWLLAVSVLVLLLIRSGLGVGYALWVGAAALGFLCGQSLEEVVNYLSSGAHAPAALWAAGVLLAGSVSGEFLRRRGVAAAWRAWVRRRLGGRVEATILAEVGELLLPGGAPRLHAAGEGRRVPPADVRYGPWIAPALRVLAPWTPAFLAACLLFGVSWREGALAFAAFAVVVAAGASLVPAAAPARRGDDSEDVIPSPEALAWIAAPAAGLCAAGVAGLCAGLLLAAFANAAALRFSPRAAWRAAWEAMSMDWVLLAVGVAVFGEMARESGAQEALGRRLSAWGFPVSAGPLMAFLAAWLAAALGGALAGIALAAPLCGALAGMDHPSLAWMTAAVGGALLGELVPIPERPGAGDAARPSPAAALPMGILIAAASLLPAWLRR